MGYFLCKKCEHMFETEHMEIPERCTVCNSTYHLVSLQKQQFYDWLQIRKNTLLYRKLKQGGVI